MSGMKVKTFVSIIFYSWAEISVHVDVAGWKLHENANFNVNIKYLKIDNTMTSLVSWW